MEETAPVVIMSQKKSFLMKCLYYSGFNWLASICMQHTFFLVGYHSIGAPDNGFHENLYPHLTVSVKAFAQQMEYLSAHGHTFVSMSQLLDPAIRTVHKPTVIYFDDAFKNVMVNALPVLERYSIPATIFVTSGIADGILEALPIFSTEEVLPLEATRAVYLSWDEIREMRKEGMEFGAHGLTHVKMNQCSPEILRQELEVPRERITEEIGTAPDTLAYPHGRSNQEVIAAAGNAGYRLAVTTLEGRNTFESILRAPFSLKKIAPRPPDSFLEFKVKVYSWTMISGFF